MLNFKIKDAKDFHMKFGTVVHGNGVTSRKNKILLRYLMDENMHRYAVQKNFYDLIQVDSLVELKQNLLQHVHDEAYTATDKNHRLNIMGQDWYSNKYESDDRQGICDDGDTTEYRYINVEKNHPFKKKIGKLIKALCLETEIGKHIPESTMLWLCEEYTQEWEGYTKIMGLNYTLHVDDNFHDIYTKSCLAGEWSSCMNDRGHWPFYRDSVKAKAAYLTNKEGKIVVRAILFTDVKDENGKKWRLLERQYASNNREDLKRALIQALINGGHIDGYKKVGAGCSEARAFVDTKGNDLSNKKFSIGCNLSINGILSYQDSFKHYQYKERIARNWGGGDYDLGTTQDYLEYGRERRHEQWDSYHHTFCDHTVTVLHKGIEYTCDENRLEDFEHYGGRLYHKDDVVKCDCCGCSMLDPMWYPEAGGLYSEITQGHYCEEECMIAGEKSYKAQHWYYSEIDDEYYPYEAQVTNVNIWDGDDGYDTKTISVDSLNQGIIDGTYVEEEGFYYDHLNKYGIPYGEH